MTGLHKICENDTEWISPVHWPLKNLLVKIQGGRRPMHSEHSTSSCDFKTLKMVVPSRLSSWDFWNQKF